MTDIEALWQQLEERDEFAQPARSYPDADGRRTWIVTMHRRGYHGVTLAEAIQAALDAPPPLPRVPRPPLVLVGAHPVRNGSSWTIREGDGATYGRFKTKAQAQSAIAAQLTRYEEHRKIWAPVTAGTYGVDWLWQDDPH